MNPQSFDALLARAEDIAQLRDRRIQVRAGKADLPKRRAELAAAEATLNRLAGELEWTGDVDQLIARIPAKAKLAVLRGLLNRRGAQSGAVENAKSAVAEAFAKECGVNFAQIYLGQLLGKYVGDSESNLERLLQALEALAPVVVFADELDQQMRRSEGGDNSVERNMFGRLLAFMADPGNHGRILWLGASNRPDLMDAALMRPGRFDVRLVFPPPAAEERRAIMHIFAKQQGLDVDQIPDEAVTATEGWTGAELANAMRKAALLVDADNMPPATAVIEATRRILAKTKDIDWMLKLALETANDTDLIPERLLPLMANRDALRREVRAGIEEREREFAPRSL